MSDQRENAQWKWSKTHFDLTQFLASEDARLLYELVCCEILVIQESHTSLAKHRT